MILDCFLAPVEPFHANAAAAVAKDVGSPQVAEAGVVEYLLQNLLPLQRIHSVGHDEPLPCLSRRKILLLLRHFFPILPHDPKDDQSFVVNLK